MAGRRPFDGTTTRGGYVDVIVHRRAWVSSPPCFVQSVSTTKPSLTGSTCIGILRRRAYAALRAPVGSGRPRPSAGGGALQPFHGTRPGRHVFPSAPLTAMPSSSATPRSCPGIDGWKPTSCSASACSWPSRSGRCSWRHRGRSRMNHAAVPLPTSRLAVPPSERLLNARGGLRRADTPVTELPVFRAHLSDPRLANDQHTMDEMTDRYRQLLRAEFCIVTGLDGRWISNPGWPVSDAPTTAVASTIASTLRGTRHSGGCSRSAIGCSSSWPTGPVCRRGSRGNGSGLRARRWRGRGDRAGSSASTSAWWRGRGSAAAAWVATSARHSKGSSFRAAARPSEWCGGTLRQLGSKRYVEARFQCRPA